MRALCRSLFATLPVLGLLLVPGVARSQVTLGLNGGVSFSSFDGDDVHADQGTSTGFLFGGTVSFPVYGVISVAPGLYWVEKGAEFDEGAAEVSRDLDYLEVPILGVFRVTGPERPVGASVFLGPSVAFELSCSDELEVGGDDLSFDCDDDPDLEDRETVDFGLVFGGGVSFPLNEDLSVGLAAGLDVGLRSIEDDRDVKNSLWFLSAGLGFPLGG